MMITRVSKNRLLDSFSTWYVGQEAYEPIFNYLVHGLSPGSFYSAILANDFTLAMTKSHPLNSIGDLKALSEWLINRMPAEAWGSKEAVLSWYEKTDEERRKILEDQGLIYTPEQETFLLLST